MSTLVNNYTIEPLANLEGANLEGANLEGANLEGANLREANLPAKTQHISLAGAYSAYTTDGGENITIGCKTKSYSEWKEYLTEYDGGTKDRYARVYALILPIFAPKFLGDPS